MADNTIDVLMRVVPTDEALATDSLTQFLGTIGTDVLRDGFQAGKFCDLRQFDFSAGVGGSMSKNAQKQKDKDKEQPVANAAQGAVTMEEKRRQLEKSQRKAGKKLDKLEQLDMQPVEYTRLMDRMSTRLFQALTTCETINELSIVKRKATGSANSGECYLRLDFQKVLFIKLEWKDEEDKMVESGSFIYRKLTIQYRPQTPAGPLGNIVSQSWSMQEAERRRSA